MTVRLRVVLDQVVSPTSPDLAEASQHLLAALANAAPSGCEVAGIVPAVRGNEPHDGAAFDDIAAVWRAPVQRRELAAAWRMGTGLGVGAGMIHSPTLMAPLVRHDRAHDHDQTVVTLWGLEAWTAPGQLDRADVAWQRAMLRRAVRFADAVVVPTHAMAAELAEIAPLGARIRVIAGAPKPGFGPPADASSRARALGLPERYIALLGRGVDPDALASAFRAIAAMEIDAVIVGDESDDPARIFALARAEGIADHRVRAPHVPDPSDRASILAGAVAVVAASETTAFPWRALEALAVGAPLIAARTAQNEELFADGAHLVAGNNAEEIGEALRRMSDDEPFRSRLRVLAADRARAFSWRDAAERVWQLHAEL